MSYLDRPYGDDEYDEWDYPFSYEVMLKIGSKHPFDEEELAQVEDAFGSRDCTIHFDSPDLFVFTSVYSHYSVSPLGKGEGAFLQFFLSRHIVDNIRWISYYEKSAREDKDRYRLVGVYYPSQNDAKRQNVLKKLGLPCEDSRSWFFDSKSFNPFEYNPAFDQAIIGNFDSIASLFLLNPCYKYEENLSIYQNSHVGVIKNSLNETEWDKLVQKRKDTENFQLWRIDEFNRTYHISSDDVCTVLEENLKNLDKVRYGETANAFVDACSYPIVDEFDNQEHTIYVKFRIITLDYGLDLINMYVFMI